MGGSGDPRYPGDVDPDVIREEATRRLEAQELVTDINEYLGELLKDYNDRDTDSIAQKLDELLAVLGEAVEGTDRLLFGGSIAKHTYVDGLSDVDALVVVSGLEGESPEDLVRSFADAIRSALPSSVVSEVTPGTLAVTVRYTDGAEIQLLPAKERNTSLSIASEDGTQWRVVRPRKFAEKLTEVNKATNGGAVPVVKLAKPLLEGLPEPQRLTGYHVEAIAVDAFRNYAGPMNRQAMLRHLLDHASRAVLSPTSDITGQSVRIDDHLGAAGSSERQAVSASIQRIVNKMDAATSVEDYKDLFGE